VIGAGSRGEFREEDQMGCAWVAQQLVDAGYRANPSTLSIIDQWRDSPPESCAHGNSAAYLRRTNQEKDLDFILDRIDDIDEAFVMANGMVTCAGVRETISVPVYSRPVYSYGS
jgi:2-phosphosulfolactate phosphatase